MTAKQSIFEKCPSGIHREFFDYAFKFFEDKGCKAILKGSIHKNTANTFSDIDLVLKGMSKEIAEEFIYGYGEVALISRTERPLGIIIVVYSNGLALDLDFREKITKEEFENPDKFGTDFIEEDIADELIRCENILEFDKQDAWESVQRLFHRSLVKWKGGKEELGYSILLEIVDFLRDETNETIEPGGDYLKDFSDVLSVFTQQYILNEKYIKVIENILEGN